MSLDDPGPEVIEAVEAAVAWFEAAKLPGLKVVKKEDPRSLGQLRELVSNFY